jgi:hypothetical protein
VIRPARRAERCAARIPSLREQASIERLTRWQGFFLLPQHRALSLSGYEGQNQKRVYWWA